MLSGRRRALRLLAASSLAASIAGCGVLAPRKKLAGTEPATEALPPRLPAREHQWARTAWRYVENNTDFDSGLVAGSDHLDTFTPFQAGDALAAIVAARELNVIDAREFDLRLSRVLGFLATMDLSQGLLPNKAYSVTSMKMVNFGGQPDDIGWSAIDVGRLLLWLRIVGARHPQHREHVDRAVLRWTFCDAIDDCGGLRGSQRVGNDWPRYQEGRLGYEQLAGAGYAAWGFDARRSAGLPATELATVEGVTIHHDARDPRTTGAQAPVLTSPWVLLGMELGWSGERGAAWRALADETMRAQEARWRRHGLMTARTDYLLREPPYVVLDSVFASGYAWNTVAHDAKEREQLALVATRAAFGLWALWPGDYADRLVASIQTLYDPDRGWYEGRFEAGGAPLANITLSTNAQVLEALLFRATGAPFLPANVPEGVWERETRDPFKRLARCWPAERAGCKA